ncbi:hypothetical protein [uncultured Agitococcus sp.]|uniref:hypothetical protein n=1 Tax=uncultured Agitococcus sp. TaxID=1506599 RepID=UPI00262A068D|nr:hypothetical protein [uncultured Agitococcus sp.]
MKIPFFGGQKKGFSKNQNAQETVNMFLELDSSETDTNISLIRVDGKKLFLNLPTVPILSMLEFRGILYVVTQTQLYKVLFDGSYTALGSVNCDIRTTMTANNVGEIMIVCGVLGYVLNTNTDTLTQVTNPAFYGSPRVDYLDGYGVLVRPNSQQFYISAYNDFLTFDGLEFATNGSDPDNLVTGIVDHRELVLFGRKTTSFWFAIEGTTFSLDRRQGADMEVGCAAALSVAKLDNTVYFLGRSSHGTGLVYKLNQYVPQIISNRGIEHLINSFNVIDDAFAFTYQKSGHSFYVLTFPSEGKTLVYDASIAEPDLAWHIRETYQKGRDRASCYAFAFNRHLVGDFESGTIYEYDEDTHLDGGQPIAWYRTGQHIIADYKRLRHKEVVLNFERGVGLESGDDPLCYLTYSDDGGHTFITPRECSMGVIGQRKNRTMWARLGQSRDRVYKVFGSAPVKTVLNGGYIDVEAGKT